MIAGQLFLAILSNCVAFALRFDGAIPAEHIAILVQTLPWLVLIRGVTFVRCRLDMGLWRYTSVSDLCNIVVAVASSTALCYVMFSWVLGLGYSRSILVIDSLVLFVLLSGIRLSHRVLPLLARKKGTKRVLIYGAGDAGEMIVRDMRGRPYGYEPLGFIDDDATKVGQRIHGVPVLGGRNDLGRIMVTGQPHEILVAVPSANLATLQGLVESLRPFKVPITTLPSVRDLLDGRVAVNQIRQLTIADLLPRAPVNTNPEAVRQLIEGRRVLVTGAGGSIGSELSRQIAALNPAALVLFERYENALYDVTNNLVDQPQCAGVWPIIGDVTDSSRVDQVLDQYRPQVVFHAAAHKHVPLMEHNVCEAVKNNVIGTMTMADAAERHGVEQFILISTDKAVNPSSVMGATKRVGELIVQTMSEHGTTCFSTVRFGNVLGSNGSVVPRFVDQIKAGGPVTVTHPEIRRFFMLIPEAVHLVLHAATLEAPGAAYVLDMGEPIKLVDLARNVIRLAGYVPEKEIAIRFVGLRPGEKLFEELLGTGETAEPSRFDRILRVRQSCHLDPGLLESQLLELVSIAWQGDSAGVIQQLRRILPEFEPPGEDVEAAVVAATGFSSRQSRFPNHLHGPLNESQSSPLVSATHG